MKATLIGALKSKTVWFNVITGVLAVVDKLSGTDLVSAEILAIVVTVGNFALRFLTSKPLVEKKSLLS